MKEKILAIDIGGSKILVGAVEGDRIISSVRRDLPKTYDFEFLLSVIEELVLSLNEKDFAAVGVTVPGLVDTKLGVWRFSPFSGIENIPIAEILSRRFSLPVFIENDVNACALAEKKHGCCSCDGDFLWFTVSNGIGGALFVNGELYSGVEGCAAEIGHLKVAKETGALCGCGKVGCLEAISSGKGIERAYFKDKGEALSAKEIAQKAKKGDASAIRTFMDAGKYIGIAISHAVNLLNIRKVVLGGGVMQSSELLLPYINSHLAENLFEQANGNIKIEISALGYNAALIGAATVAQMNMKRDYKMNEKEFLENYAAQITRALDKTDFTILEKIADKIFSLKDTEATVYTAGNGGSAATASHICNDLLKGCGVCGRSGFKAESLCDSTAVLTCLANDFDYESVFSIQLKAKARAGDLLIVYSGSGNSANIIKLVKLAGEMGVCVIGFTGRDGGMLLPLCDLALVAPTDSMEQIEDLHMLYTHALSSLLQSKLKNKYSSEK